jgi:DnaJ family protein C protein 13
MVPIEEKNFRLCKNVFVFQKNVKDLMDSNGIRILVDLLTLAHLHVSRATVPLQVRTLVSVLQASQES